MDNLTSRPYRPRADVCCEACVFGRGPHSDWCEKGKAAEADVEAESEVELDEK